MSDANEDFVSFEKAPRDLKLQSEQLKKMVSQGDIRAFRVGDSMQFRAEDVAALQSSDAEEDLVFADALEDDTGMVTEELSEEDTLLVEDDEDEEVVPVAAARPQRSSRREAISAQKTEAADHPIWLALTILCFVALLWGALVSWDISSGAAPGESILTKPWAPN